MRVRWIMLTILAFLMVFALFLFYQQNRGALAAPIIVMGKSLTVAAAWTLSLAFTAIAAGSAWGISAWRFSRRNRIQSREQEAKQDRASVLMQVERSLANECYPQALADLTTLGHSVKVDELRIRALQGQGDHDQATEEARSAYARHKSPVFGYLLATADAKNGRLDQALERYNEILMADPGAVRARQGKFEVLKRQHKWAECLELLPFFETHKPEFYRVQFPGIRYEHLRQRLDNEGPNRQIHSAIDDLTQSYPEFVPGYTLAADSYIKRSEIKKAFDVYERAYQKTGHAVFLSMIAEYYIDNDRPEDAIQVLRQLMVKEKHAQVSYFLGRLYQRLEMTEDAHKVLEPLLRRNPENTHLALRLSDTLSRLDRPKEAFQIIRQCMAHLANVDHEYECHACGHGDKVWTPRCRACERWNTLDLAFTAQRNKIQAQSPIYY
ncbi:MAG: tetratricopeptide repeat protein [Acidobacteria bacterium]|nr:tetratricopeptide repeat protein [Acidobacteriota bacterium]